MRARRVAASLARTCAAADVRAGKPLAALGGKATGHPAVLAPRTAEEHSIGVERRLECRGRQVAHRMRAVVLEDGEVAHVRHRRPMGEQPKRGG
jgi:hypothetical protein